MDYEEISELFIRRDISFTINSRDGPHIYGVLFFNEPMSFNELRDKLGDDDIQIYPKNLTLNETINALIIPDEIISAGEFNDISRVDVVSNISRRDGGILLEVRNSYYGAMEGIYKKLEDKRYFLIIFL